MLALFDAVKNIFKNKSKSKDAYERLDRGETIQFSPRSDRYTYNSGADTRYDKKWTPATSLEKKTLAPEGYYRQGDRLEQKTAIYSGIFDAAKKGIKKDHPTYNQDKLDNEATKEADEVFNEEYREKQISVPSTALKTVSYNPDNKILEVKFTSGSKKYDYPHVPLETVQALMKAPSKGEYFMKNIHDQYSLNYMRTGTHAPSDRQEIKNYKNYINKIYKEAKAAKKEAKAMAKGMNR